MPYSKPLWYTTRDSLVPPAFAHGQLYRTVSVHSPAPEDGDTLKTSPQFLEPPESVVPMRERVCRCQYGFGPRPAPSGRGRQLEHDACGAGGPADNGTKVRPTLVT